MERIEWGIAGMRVDGGVEHIVVTLLPSWTRPEIESDWCKSWTVVVISAGEWFKVYTGSRRCSTVAAVQRERDLDVSRLKKSVRSAFPADEEGDPPYLSRLGLVL